MSTLRDFSVVLFTNFNLMYNYIFDSLYHTILYLILYNINLNVVCVFQRKNKFLNVQYKNKYEQQ